MEGEERRPKEGGGREKEEGKRDWGCMEVGRKVTRREKGSLDKNGILMRWLEGTKKR